MRLLLRIIPALVAGFLPIALLAAGEVRFQRISMADGLTQSSISSMVQCGGYMWFATQYGLNRYDAYAFKPFRHEPDDPGSLSNSAVRQLKCDESGDLWVATRDGLNRFDTRTGQATRYFLPELVRSDDSRSLMWIRDQAPNGTLFLDARGHVGVLYPDAKEIELIPFGAHVDDQVLEPSASLVDGQGRYWLLNRAGLWKLDELRMEMILVRPVEPDMRNEQSILLLELTTEGHLAMVAGRGLELVDPDQTDHSRTIRPTRFGHSDDGIEGLATTSDGSIWMVLDTSLVRFHPDADDWEVLFDAGERETGERRDAQFHMVEDHQGDYWMSGLYGVSRWRPETQSLQVFFYDPSDDYSIPASLPTFGYNLYVDDFGTVWVGSHLGGLVYFAPHAHRFEHIRDRSALGEIPYAGHNIVRGIAEQNLDDREYLWIALDSAGLRQLRREPDGGYDWVRSFHANGPQDERLPGDRLWEVVVDPLSDLVWVLESEYLVAIDPHQSKVVATVPVPLAKERGRAKRMRFSKDGSALWVATARGVEKFHVGEERTRLRRCSRSPGLHGQRIYNLLEIDEGRILAAGRDGLGLISFHGESSERVITSEALGVGPSEEFFGLSMAPGGGVWVGSGSSGLAHVQFDPFDNDSPTVQWYGREHGLVDETIYAILREPAGQLWLSSNQGLMRFDPQSGSLHQFTPPDGVQHFEFNNAVAHVGSSGRYYFGGINGVTAFQPEKVHTLQQPPRVKLQEVMINGAGKTLDTSTPVRLNLTHDQNDLDIRFVGLHFADPRRIRYAYKLEGLDQEWGQPGDQRQVRYAGLAPGNYRLLVRASNSDGVWSDEHELLTAVVRYPPWQTTWAYVAYLLTGLLLLALAYGMHRHRRMVLEDEVKARTLKLEQQQGLIHRQAEELRDALEARGQFFTSISHEFRTPLTLILSSLDRLEAQGGEPAAVERGRRYSRLLLDLVDDLLDLSRLRAMTETGSGGAWALSPGVAFTVEAFRHNASERGLNLHSELEEAWWTRCSQEHVEKILLNLLANAIKFTAAGDTIKVRLHGDDDGAILEVIDTGPGIPAEERVRIFRQFHRSASAVSDRIEGTGIGLALVREMALVMGGEVVLESEPGRGSCFRVLLPAFRDETLKVDGVELFNTADPQIPEEVPLASGSQPFSEKEETRSGQGEVVLVVEDNPDLREHLRYTLEGQWKILLAADGRQGLEQAIEHHPDLIVSDIMMPGLDGFELLEALRANPDTSHIPVLLLTARQDRETRLKGLALSADDFMAKPFDDSELKVRLQRMLDNRKRLRRHLLHETARAQMDSGQDNPDLVDRDRELVARINQILADRLSEPEFDVATLCEALAIERRTLQRKLKALTGLTPAAYIRHFRLAQARRLLLETDRSVNEVALHCGFSSAQHFSRLFRKQYQAPPDQWRQQNRDDQDGPAD